MFKLAIKTARLRGLKIVHYALMHNHLHLLIEAENNQELSKGMQSFALSLNKLVNNRLNHRIRHLWSDRYFMRPLRSPKEIKTALLYIINNPNKKFSSKNTFDLYTSAVSLSNFQTKVTSIQNTILHRFTKFAHEYLHPPNGFLLKRVLNEFV